MISIENWMNDKASAARLFDEDNLIVNTYVHNKMTKLKRDSGFDDLMIDTVEQGLRNDHWEGFIYIMHWNNS
ncbi:MAG: hypothetical protein KDB79_09450, partial [Acidobacteria bacterium]|nr:hypothetical protein [Acidobacteriota bacterium]